MVWSFVDWFIQMWHNSNCRRKRSNVLMNLIHDNDSYKNIACCSHDIYSYRSYSIYYPIRHDIKSRLASVLQVESSYQSYVQVLPLKTSINWIHVISMIWQQIQPPKIRLGNLLTLACSSHKVQDFNESSIFAVGMSSMNIAPFKTNQTTVWSL